MFGLFKPAKQPGAFEVGLREVITKPGCPRAAVKLLRGLRMEFGVEAEGGKLAGRNPKPAIVLADAQPAGHKPAPAVA